MARLFEMSLVAGPADQFEQPACSSNWSTGQRFGEGFQWEGQAAYEFRAYSRYTQQMFRAG
ncbi:unnamed protein product [Amoebophrya sp. A120]|nr:unnamed protein product [Amoebophrya sp. A120]|eukprot:GSA120T00015667001.1